MSETNDAVVYQKLIALMIRAKRHMFEICESRQLTPVQGMMITCMPSDGSKTMNELAEMMCCDASNITGLTERLETHGIVERTAAEHDKRIKEIKLSTKGAGCRQAILDELGKAEALDMKALTKEEVNLLRTILSKLV